MTDRFSDDQLRQLRMDFDDHVAREEQMFQKLVASQEENTHAILALTQQVTQLTSDTQDIVRLYRDFQAAGRVGTGMKKLISNLLIIIGAMSLLGGGTLFLMEELQHELDGTHKAERQLMEGDN